MDHTDFFINNSSFLVKARADAPKTLIRKIEKDIVFLDIHAPAQDNKANKEIVKFLSKLTKRHVRIIRGLSSKEKLIVLQ